MTKLCECGCGKPAALAKYTSARLGLVKGQPQRFARGHRAPEVVAKWIESNTSHGMNGTPEEIAYRHAKSRCQNPKHKQWDDYGGRGIEFRFTCFGEFFLELGFRPGPEYSLDRKDNNGHYELGNVRWATKAEQNANQRPVTLETCAKRSAFARSRSDRSHGRFTGIAV